jgi:choline dehydrogenase-like flavoprotein
VETGQASFARLKARHASLLRHRACAAFIRRTALTAHPPAGMPHGSDVGAVLDPPMRVQGLEGLRVVDASAMPDLVSAHINACVLMMAEKASDLIREQGQVAGSPRAAA